MNRSKSSLPNRVRSAWTFIAPRPAARVAMTVVVAVGLAGAARAQNKPATPPTTPGTQPATPAAPARPATANPATGQAKPDAAAPKRDPSTESDRISNRAPARQRGSERLDPSATPVPPAKNVAVNPGGAAEQAAPASTVLTFDPPVLDFGDMSPDVAKTAKVKITNISDKPVTVTKVVPGCGCTSTVWPKEPIQPGASDFAEFTLRPGAQQGIDLHKKATFQLDGQPPVVYSLTGHVKEWVRISPAFIDGPGPDEAVSGEVTLTAADGAAFKVVSANPPIIKNLNDAEKPEQKLEIDWAAWAEAGKPPKLSLTLSHPNLPQATVIIKRSLKDLRQPQPPAAGAAAAANPPRAQNTPPIIQTVRNGDLAQLKLLLAEATTDVNAVDQVGGGRTALHWAVREGKKDLIPALLDAKINIDAADRVGKTALSMAAEGKDTEVVTLLIGRGANVNVRDQIGGSPLLWAAGLGTPEMVSLLISKGAEVNVVDVNGLSPLLWAAGIGSPDTVKALLKAGAKVELADKITGDTALMRAARTGKPESVKALLDAKAPVNARNTLGMTAFMLAAASSSIEKLEMLKAAGAEIEAKDVKGWNALDHAKNRIDADKAKVVAYLEPFVPASGAASPPQQGTASTVGAQTPAAAGNAKPATGGSASR